MPTFIYKAKDGPSKVVTGSIQADTRDLAVKKLNQKDYFPIEVYEQYSAGKISLKSYFAKIKKADVATFTRQMSDLIDSGIPVFKALSIVKEQTENFKLKNIIDDIAEKVQSGQSLSDSLSNHPKLFSGLYIALVKSGELGGNLDKTLLRIADLLEKEDDLKTRIKAAMAYPAIMIIVGVITVIVLITWVIPKLLYMFEEIGQVLPLPTRILLNISGAFSSYWWLILIVLWLIVIFYRKITATAEGMHYIGIIKLNIPILKDLIVKKEITRFTRTLGTLLGSGVEMISSLKAASDVIENKIIQEEVSKMIPKIQDGARLTEALKNIKQFPVLIPNMVAVGEESGRLDEILIKISNSYDRKVNYSIKVITNLLEPVIILVMGLIIAFLVVSILLPIFTIDFAAW